MRKKLLSLLIVTFLSIVLGSTVTSAKEIVVKKGDSLWKISRAHNTTVQNLKNVNDLHSDLIFPKQKLYTKSSEVAAKTSKKIAAPSKQAVSANSSSKAAKTSQKSKVSTSHVSGKELTVTATAYTANCSGCSGITAIGINLKKNPNQKVIAVDPKIIPLGSKVYVEGYGTAIAGDTGGAIKGNKIDVFVRHVSTAYQWGVRKVKIKILS